MASCVLQRCCPAGSGTTRRTRNTSFCCLFLCLLLWPADCGTRGPLHRTLLFLAVFDVFGGSNSSSWGNRKSRRNATSYNIATNSASVAKGQSHHGLEHNSNLSRSGGGYNMMRTTRDKRYLRWDAPAGIEWRGQPRPDGWTDEGYQHLCKRVSLALNVLEINVVVQGTYNMSRHFWTNFLVLFKKRKFISISAVCDIWKRQFTRAIKIWKKILL